MSRTHPARTHPAVPGSLLLLCLATVAIGQTTKPGPAVQRSPAVTSSPFVGLPAPVLDENTQILMEYEVRSMNGWRQRDGEPSEWKLIRATGSARVHAGDAVSEAVAGDFQMHLEFKLPLMADATGQARANSGVYLHGRYEVQVLDSYGLEPGMGDCGAIYSIAPPRVNACLPPEEWQTYDIVFRAPRFDDVGTMTKPAYVTVVHNGIVIHNNVELPHTTPGGLDREMVAAGPLLLQDHGNDVEYRNIWVRKLN